MTGLWVWSLSRDSLTLIIGIIPIKRHCSPINTNAVIVLRIKLLHLFDTSTHLSGNHLPRHFLTHNSRLFPAVDHCPCVRATPESMKTAPIIPTLHFFHRPIRYWLFLILWNVIFMNGFEAWKVEINRVAIDWDTGIRPDMDIVVSVARMEGRRVVQWNLSVRWHLLAGQDVLIFFVVVLY